MPQVPTSLRQLVMGRASGRCEYCHLSQTGQEAAFHIDHVLPVTLGGQTEAENLALACVSCSLRKGARVNAIDPETGTESPLFNPRREVWSTNFEWRGVSLIGLTPTGRATVKALDMNRALILGIREEQIALDEAQN